MAWADTRGMIRDVLLLLLGTVIIVHELLMSAGDRPLLLGAGLSCLGLPLVSGARR